MKFTNKDLLIALDLKVGDKIFIDNVIEAVIITENSIELVKADVLISIKDLIGREFKKVGADKTVGNMKCSDFEECVRCPLKPLACGTTLLKSNNTLNEYLEKLKPTLDKIDNKLYPIFKEKLNK